MNVKEAVDVAKKFIEEAFAQENITNLGLEEVEFDEAIKEWRVTVGFSRPWELAGGFAAALQPPAQRRSYKVVLISDGTQQVVSVINRGGNA